MVFGCRMPSKYACWASLTVTAWLVPRASLRGHVCGVLSGLVLVFVPHAGARAAPVPHGKPRGGALDGRWPVPLVTGIDHHADTCAVIPTRCSRRAQSRVHVLGWDGGRLGGCAPLQEGPPRQPRAGAGTGGRVCSTCSGATCWCTQRWRRLRWGRPHSLGGGGGGRGAVDCIRWREAGTLDTRMQAWPSIVGVVTYNQPFNF